MILYNITIKVETSIAADWQDWMLTVHMPEVLATGCFDSSRLLRLLEVDEQDGPTYAVQFTAPGKAQYDRYMAQFADGLRKKTLEKWGNRYVAFRSSMELVQ